MTIIKRRRKETKFRKGELVRHVREPDSMGLVMDVVRNVPIPGAKALPPATYQIYWSAGTDAGTEPFDCWYEEEFLEGVEK